MMMRQTENPSAFYTLIAGGLAGTFSWLISFPVDVVKSRLQVDGMDGKPKYNGAMDCVRKSVQTEGWKFLTRGLNSTLMRAFPMNAVCFLVVSYVMKYFENKNIDVTLAQPEQLAIVDAPIPQTFMMRVFHRQQTDHHHHKNTKYMIFLDGFHTAACHSEMMDLSDALRESRQSTTYFYRMNNEITAENLSDDEMKTPLM
jgi:solute carrier family 25 (mitochondrial carnitine/acylcarnitine transporter), member 20/29